MMRTEEEKKEVVSIDMEKECAEELVQLKRSAWLGCRGERGTFVVLHYLIVGRLSQVCQFGARLTEAPFSLILGRF